MRKVKRLSVATQLDKLHISCETTEDMSFEEWAFEHRLGLFGEVMGISPRLRVRRQL